MSTDTPSGGLPLPPAAPTPAAPAAATPTPAAEKSKKASPETAPAAPQFEVVLGVVVAGGKTIAADAPALADRLVSLDAEEAEALVAAGVLRPAAA